MKAFLKENSVLIIGLSLPLILALLFLVVQFFSNISIAAPQHAVLFTTGNNYSNHGHRIYVKNNQVHYAFNTLPNNRPNNNLHYERSKPRVFLYNPINNTSKEISTPTIESYKENTDIVLTEITAKEILTTFSSPDGYALETSHYRGGNVFTEITGGRRHYSNHIINLKKRTKRVPIEIPINQNSYNYYNRNVRFLGWIIEE